MNFRPFINSVLVKLEPELPRFRMEDASIIGIKIDSCLSWDYFVATFFFSLQTLSSY